MARPAKKTRFSAKARERKLRRLLPRQNPVETHLKQEYFRYCTRKALEALRRFNLVQRPLGERLTTPNGIMSDHAAPGQGRSGEPAHVSI